MLPIPLADNHGTWGRRSYIGCVEERTVVSWRGCGECGYFGPWSEGDGACPRCRTDRDSAEGTALTIPLTFAAAVCDNCRSTGPGGSCSSCGSAVALPEPNDATRARVAALAPLRARARALADSFDHFPQAHIPVTTQQAIAVVVDAELSRRAAALIEFAHRVGDLDLKTPRAIGSSTRRQVIETLDEVERVRDEARRLAAFRPPDEIEELAPAVARVAGCGARVVAAVIEVISAETLADAQNAAGELQASLTAPRELDRITELLALAPNVVGREDIDARASLALGMEGQYTDELGMTDPVKIFAAASNQSLPMTALAHGAGGYLTHLLDTPPAELPDGAAVLALCAVQLAVVDRPFGPHRLAELVRDLLRRAAARAPDELAQALSRYDEQQGRAFAAASRAIRAMRLLALGRIDEPVDVVASVLSIYRRLAEGPFRESMRLVLAARAAAEGRDAPDESLLLGDIDGLLDGWHEELGESLRGAVDRDLRNAEAHEQFRIDPQSLEIVTDERRVAPESLNQALGRLTSTLAALEAATLCHRLDSRDALRTPEWLIRGDHPDALAMILQMVAGAQGIEIVSISGDQGQLTLVLDGPAARDAQRARVVLVSALPLVPKTDELRAMAANRLVTAISSQAVRAWQQADSAEEDLALIELLFDSRVRAGTSADEALGDALCAALRVVLNVDVPNVVQAPGAHTPLDRLARRLRRITRFAATNRNVLAPTDRPVLAWLRAASLAANAAVFEPATLPEIAAALEPLEMWAAARGALPEEYVRPA